jgi:alpha-mannosidase
MGGCSIKEAYEDAREVYGEALNIGAEILNASLQKISWSIDTMKPEIASISKEMDWKSWEYRDCGAPLVVFNSLSWEVHAPVQVNRAVKGITDETGKALPIQKVRASQTNGSADKWDTLFTASIPALGYKVFWMYMNKEFQSAESLDSLHAEGSVLENAFVRLEIDPYTGYITRLFDKQNNVEALKDKGAVPVVIDEHHCDTWAHHVFEFRNEVGRFGDAKIKWLEQGPVRARLRVINRYNDSTLQQDFILYHDRADVEVRVKLDWREKHKMLKLSFPVNVNNPKAVYEIPYGFMERPVSGTEEPGQQWLDVSGIHKTNEDVAYGLALLNDSKYSFDVKENDLRMTVVRSPIFADHFGERDEWVEYMDQGIQEFRYSLVPHAGCWKDAGVVQKAYELNVPPVQVIETYHEGTLPQRFEGIQLSAGNIIASVLKKAEDGDGYILRCYETAGRETDVTIEIPMLGRKWRTTFGICEIKTFHIPVNGKEPVSEKNLIELE